jgi:carbon monoxide dehydrogenase subunit G
MEMTGQRTLPVPPQQAWDALNDPAALQACIAGCESIALVAPDQYELVMSARIGPVAARFKGKLSRSDAVEPVSYRIAFDGQGGAAGFGKGTADVRLTPVEQGTLLDYSVKANVGGKIAQIGSRLIDGAARKIADDFFAAFEARIVGQAGAAQAAAGPGEAAAAGPGEAAPPPAPVPMPAAPASSSRIGWVIAAAIAVALLAWLLAR